MRKAGAQLFGLPVRVPVGTETGGEPAAPQGSGRACQGPGRCWPSPMPLLSEEEQHSLTDCPFTGFAAEVGCGVCVGNAGFHVALAIGARTPEGHWWWLRSLGR